jgi:hypothetical protein
MKKDEHARKRKELTKRKIQEEKTAALNRLVSSHNIYLLAILTTASSNLKRQKLAALLPSQRRYSCLRSKPVKRQLKKTKITNEPTLCTPVGSVRRMAYGSACQKSGSERAPVACSVPLCHLAMVPSSKKLTEVLCASPLRLLFALPPPSGRKSSDMLWNGPVDLSTAEVEHSGNQRE